jgi:hypothetical protein
VLAVNDDHGQIVGTSYACAACATGMTLSAERDDVVRPGGHRPDLNGRLRLASCRCRWLYRDALGSLRAAALTMIINKA